MVVDELILKKWSSLIGACKNYYIDSLPTGMLDSEYDELEQRAILEDGFFVRDYVIDTFSKGTRSKNSYIEKIKKTKVEGKTMMEAIEEFQTSLGEQLYCDLKYDGSSLAIYLDPSTGTPLKVVTVGNLNIDNYGIDQSWKLLKFLPSRFPVGIVAIQAEALIDTDRLGDDFEKARQRANGLINSKYCEADISNLLTIRAYRYYTDSTPQGVAIRNADYREVLQSFQTVLSPADGHILFAPADIWTVAELKSMPGFTETDHTQTKTGKFLNDGYVLYSRDGICKGALKFAGAGSSTETEIVTTVKEIIWNNQVSKGKDSWSANVSIDPVSIKGNIVKKPSAGSVSKLVKNNITPGAKVTIILANSTIPMVGETKEGGNGNYNWPKCSCGYQMSVKDVSGSNLKCGNPNCTERLGRMVSYLELFTDFEDLRTGIDFNKFFVIDRFKWENTTISFDQLYNFLVNNDQAGYKKYLEGFMKTDLQKANLDLVIGPSWNALVQVLIGC